MCFTDNKYIKYITKLKKIFVKPLKISKSVKPGGRTQRNIKQIINICNFVIAAFHCKLLE